MDAITLLSGSSCNNFATRVCKYLNVSLGKATLDKFMNGETRVELHECLRGKHIFIIQSGSGDINGNILEMLIMIHSCKISSSRRITAVIPCFPYARQDKKDRSRAPITAKLIANMLTVAGADHIITMDLHASQLQGFFDIPVDNLYAHPTFIDYVKSHVFGDLVIVSPDAGGAKRASFYADSLNADLAIIHKERTVVNRVSNMVLVGDVRNKVAVVVDDIADTCGTLTMAAEKLEEAGASEVYALITHGIFSGPAVSRIEQSFIKKVVVVDTIELPPNVLACPKIELLSVSNVFAEAIRRIVTNKSLSPLFTELPPIQNGAN